MFSQCILYLNPFIKDRVFFGDVNTKSSQDILRPSCALTAVKSAFSWFIKQKMHGMLTNVVIPTGGLKVTP